MTTTRTDVPRAASAPTRVLAGTGVLAAAVASAATAGVAAAGYAAGVSPNVGAAPIPVSGYAFLTAVFSMVGVLLAVVLARLAGRPRTIFVRTTVVLTALSLVPDVIADATTGTKLLLMLTHLVAAAIVIPAVARRLAP